MKPNIRQLVLQALDNGYLMSLGTVDGGGVWVADVIFVHDDALNIYWISDTTVRHSKALKGHSQVAVTITADERSGHEHGLQITGEASRISGAHLDLAVKHWTKRGKPIPKIKDILSPNHAWYKLVPAKIELIYQPLFDFDKQTLDLDL